MAFFGFFKRDYSADFSEGVVAKDYDRFARIAGIIVRPDMRERIIRDLYALGPEEYPHARRLLKRSLRELSMERA